LQVQTAKPCARFEVTTHAGGSISHAGSALLGELAGRVAFPSTLDRDSPAGERLPCRGCWRLGRCLLERACRDLDVALGHRQLGHVGRAVDDLAADAWDQLDQPVDYGGEGGWAL
jgi:hypothetical protein